METTESTKKAARTAIQKIAHTYQKDIADLIFASVDSVDPVARTCNVTPISGKSNTGITDVALSIDRNDGDIKIPKVGSTVGIAISNTLDAFVFAWSDLDSIVLKGGLFGGLTKTQELKTQLDKLNTQLQAVVSTLQTWIPVPSDGGAALKAAFSAAIAGKLAGDFTNIENTTITHGDK